MRVYRVAYKCDSKTRFLFPEYEELSVAKVMLENYKQYKEEDPEFYEDYTDFRLQWVDMPDPVELVWQDVIEGVPKPINKEILEQESM